MHARQMAERSLSQSVPRLLERGEREAGLAAQPAPATASRGNQPARAKDEMMDICSRPDCDEPQDSEYHTYCITHRREVALRSYHKTYSRKRRLKTIEFREELAEEIDVFIEELERLYTSDVLKNEKVIYRNLGKLIETAKMREKFNNKHLKTMKATEEAAP